MTGCPEAQAPDVVPNEAARVASLPDLARLLRQLRRRDARRHGRSELTYRELAAKVGWSHATVGEYFTGQALPPTDRFDILIRLLGAVPAEQRALATARDQVEERRRGQARLGRAAARAAGGRSLGSRSDTRGRHSWNGLGDGRGTLIPRQLPPAVRHFAGRVTELATLTTLLDQAAGAAEPAGSGAQAPVPGGPAPGGPAPRGPAPAGATVILVVSGSAGIGKTAMALHWAHRVADRFPDGQLYVNLRGFDPTGSPVDPAVAVRGFLDALGVPPSQIPASLDAMVGLYRSLLAGRSMLVVLDNAHDSEQVRRLLPGSPQCLVVVTSRSQLTQLISAEAAQPLSLDLFTVAEAREFITGRLGQHVLAGEPEAVDEVITLCARLPLALSIAAARAADHPGFPLAALAGELRDASDGLDAFDGGDPGADVRAVFSWSYHALSQPAARVFRLLGLHPGPDISIAAAASLAGVPLRPARAALAELARAHLIAEHLPGRFSLHDLLRAYARELAHEHDPPDARRSARERMLDHYLHTAHAAATGLNPHRDRITLGPPRPGVTPEAPAGLQRAQAWFTSELAVLLAAINQAVAAGFDPYAWQLAWTLDNFLDRRGRWHDWQATECVALEAARREGVQAAQAGALCALGMACDRLGRYDDAHRHLQEALTLYRAVGDQVGRAYTHMRLGGLHERQGRYRQSRGHGLEALRLYRGAGHLAGQAQALNLAGWSHARLGTHRQAIAYCNQALTLQRVLGDHQGEALTLDSLGYAHHQLGHYQQAVRCYQRAVDLFSRLGDCYFQAGTLTHLGETCHAAGDPARAGRAWQDALAILDIVDRPQTGQAQPGADGPDADQLRIRLRQLIHLGPPDAAPPDAELQDAALREAAPQGAAAREAAPQEAGPP